MIRQLQPVSQDSVLNLRRGTKNFQEKFLTSHQRRPVKGGRQGWLAIKNFQEKFLTSRQRRPVKGGRQGWRQQKITAQIM
ncbi:hypothetical protein B4923_10370 [Brenneria roseae subsp. americana]|uniref:Uncharacterized protein n=1 Tax=Brenneria roseae subsp. americana TaxID=1508507 RepID=A0A2U1TS67_9GAMM|nr:hypothetical protein B4923_10370 [Brenneria roseae subsp. americana]